MIDELLRLPQNGLTALLHQNSLLLFRPFTATHNPFKTASFPQTTPIPHPVKPSVINCIFFLKVHQPASRLTVYLF